MNESFYDEDLTENLFFQELKIEYKQLIDRATSEEWIICIPKVGSFESYCLTEDDYLCHLLIPNEDKPESHYQTLNGKKVTVSNKVITIEDDERVPLLQTQILFEETFYTNDLLKYKVWCIDCLLNQNYIKTTNVECNSVLTLRDCVDFLWTESLGKNILEQLDSVINDFLIKHSNLYKYTLQIQKDLVNDLYTHCLEIALCDTRLCEGVSKNKYLINNVNVSVEAYVQHSIYKELINSISVYTSYDDAAFNKIVRNLCDIQLRDLQIRLDICDAIPCAKHHLAKINGFTTVLGKISCLRHTVSEISLSSKSTISLSVDDLLPVFVFLILKTCIPNWISNLVFLKRFQFSSLSTGDESNFLITTLEAAIEYIRSGILLDPLEPESYQTPDSALVNKTNCNEYKNKISYLFEQVRIGHYDEVKSILEKNNQSINDFEIKSKELCHPLCSCDKCEDILSQIVCNTAPTVRSSDDKGYTALHIACMYGKPKLVELLLEYDAEIQSCDYSGASPLHYAAMRGHQNALLLLLHSGADINATDNEKNTILHHACNNGHDACVKAILYFVEHQTKYLNINCANIVGDTPLHHAAKWGYKSIVHVLLEYGANPNVENKLKKAPYDYAHNFNIYQMILQAKCPFKEIDDSKVSKENECQLDYGEEASDAQTAVKPSSPNEKKRAELLLRAVAYGDIPMICYYLGLQIPDGHKKSLSSSLCHPLCDCEKCENSLDDFKINTIDKQNINVCNSEGYTALHIASLHGQTDIVQILLDNGALPNIVTRKGLTPLHLACQTQRLEIVKLLLTCNGCKVNIQDTKGNTALHYACYSKDICIVEVLIHNKANVHLRNSNGKTAFEENEWKTFNISKN